MVSRIPPRSTPQGAYPSQPAGSQGDSPAGPASAAVPSPTPSHGQTPRVVPHQSGAASRSAALLRQARAQPFASEPHTHAVDPAFGDAPVGSHRQQVGNVSFASGDVADFAALPSAADKQGKRQAEAPLPRPGAKKGKARAQTPEHVPEASPGSNRASGRDLGGEWIDAPPGYELLDDPAGLGADGYAGVFDLPDSPHDPVLDVPSGPAAEPGAHTYPEPAPFVLPDSMRLDPAIRASLQQLQNALNADPRATDLVRTLRNTTFSNVTADTFAGYLTKMGRFDAHLRAHSVRLADALADVHTFEGHARQAAGNGTMTHLRALRGACFPNTPVRQKVRELLQTDTAFRNVNQSLADRYLNHATDIDLHLAQCNRHFADVYRADGARGDAENTTRTVHFRQMKDDMMANARIDSQLKNLLKTLRAQLHPLPQDDDLATLINNAKFADGDEVSDSTKKGWRGVAPELAEALADGGVDVATFVAEVRKAGVANFQANESPFPDSTLNYKTIVKKLGVASAFDGMLRHI
jgi:hypothetical protein